MLTSLLRALRLTPSKGFGQRRRASVHSTGPTFSRKFLATRAPQIAGLFASRFRWRRALWYSWAVKQSVNAAITGAGAAAIALTALWTSREKLKTRRMNMTANGQTILITGSTDGVGRVVALRLGAQGAHVLVHGRDAKRGEAVAEEVRRRGGTATFYAADFSSLAAVRGLAEAIGREHERLDVLVNNAGIGFGQGRREESADGFELRFAVNYLAGFLLTRLLLVRLGGGKPSRIVNVASIGQQTIDFSNVMLERGYEGVRAYRQSKLAQVMFTIDLAAELAGRRVTVNSLHPATFMNTTMVRDAGVRPLSTVDEGADAILELITSPLLEGRSGLFFNGRREARAERQAYDADARRKLRELSFRLTGLVDDGGAGR